MFQWEIAGPAILDAFRKLHPLREVRNPVMFVVWVGAVFTTVLYLSALLGQGEHPSGFILAVAGWLWLTLLFANFAEAMAEGNGRARAESLRKTRQTLIAKRIAKPERGVPVTQVEGSDLRKGDFVIVEAGDLVPSDGEVVEGIAMVNESAVTGESAPVIRESGGDRSAVTGGTRVVSDWIIVRVTANPGDTFVDRMIRLVEGARRRKTPNEIALDVLLAGFTLIFLAVTVTLLPFSIYAANAAGQGAPVTLTVLISLLVA
jgi:K+-transporting ATPase ATPase B chain